MNVCQNSFNVLLLYYAYIRSTGNRISRSYFSTFKKCNARQTLISFYQEIVAFRIYLSLNIFGLQAVASEFKKNLFGKQKLKLKCKETKPAAPKTLSFITKIPQQLIAAQ